MTSLSNLDSTKLAILEVIGNYPGISSRELANKVYLSKTGLLKHADELTKLGLIIRQSGPAGSSKPGYYFTLAPSLTKKEIEAERKEREASKLNQPMNEALSLILTTAEELEPHVGAIHMVITDFTRKMSRILDGRQS